MAHIVKEVRGETVRVADTDFITKSGLVGELTHLGFGEFCLVLDGGTVTFLRRDHDPDFQFSSCIGRPHLLRDGNDEKLVDALFQMMEEAGLSTREVNPQVFIGG